MSGSINVNTFQTPEEVLELDGVADSPGVGPDNFSSLIGDYHFPDNCESLKCCCFKKGGRLCGQDHRNGYVVELVDGKKSVLGSTCVKEFDSEGELRKSISYYENAKLYEERVRKINHIFYSKEDIISNLSGKKENLLDVYRYNSGFEKSIPASAFRKLNDMARQGVDNVVVELVYIDEEVDEKTGKIEREERVVPHTLGKLKGLKIFNKDYLESLISEFSEKINLLAGLEYTNRGESSRKVATLHRKFEEIDRMLSVANELISDKFVFENSDKKLLCFLSPSFEERSILFRMWVLDSKTRGVDKSYAVESLRGMDDEIKKYHGAQEIRVP